MIYPRFFPDSSYIIYVNGRMVESCESLAKSPNLSFFPVKFPFEIRFTAAQSIENKQTSGFRSIYPFLSLRYIAQPYTQQSLSPRTPIMNY